MKNIYLQELKREIRAHRFVSQEESLSRKKWSKGNFKTCSKIIGETLLEQFTHEEMINYGTTVSYKTLEYILKYKYVIKDPIDPRSLCTLTKLAKFVGYSSWADFTSMIDSQTKQADAPNIIISPDLLWA